MKKKLLIAVCVLFLAATGVLAYFETHFGVYESKEISISDEDILKEMPDLALTDADMALKEMLFSAPEVIEALESGETMSPGETISLPDYLAEQLAEGYLPENAEMFSFGVIFKNVVYVDYYETPEKRVILEFFQDDAYGPRKIIALYGDSDDRPLQFRYINDRGELSKMKESRRWFAYFRDRMWKDWQCTCI